MDVRELFPERDEADEAQEVAIAEVCARLGRPRAWVADDGFEHTIVGGAVDGERVAWVERRSSGDEGWEDVDDFLRMRVGEALVREWVVETYNPYFGCEVGYLRWWGEDVIVVYREKHRTIACRLGPAGATQMLAIADGWTVLGDVLLYESEARGLVERVHLPELVRAAPLPAGMADECMSRGTCPRGHVMTAAPAELQRQIAAGLPGLPASVAELLIGALAYRFWDAWPPVVATYEAAYDGKRWNTPCWLPFHAHWASPEEAKERLLAQLDMVAARRPGEFGEDDTAELACRHIAARCAELAAACRAGRPPDRCYFWVEWSVADFAAAAELFPAGMWGAWEALRPRARELGALGERG